MSYEPMEAQEMELLEALVENNELQLECDELRELICDMWQWITRAAYEGSIRQYEMDRFEETIGKLGIVVEV